MEPTFIPESRVFPKNVTKKIAHQPSIFNLCSVRRESRGRYRAIGARTGWAIAYPDFDKTYSIKWLYITVCPLQIFRPSFVLWDINLWGHVRGKESSSENQISYIFCDLYHHSCSIFQGILKNFRSVYLWYLWYKYFLNFIIQVKDFLSIFCLLYYWPNFSMAFISIGSMNLDDIIYTTYKQIPLYSMLFLSHLCKDGIVKVT